jgi:hypothetical protein
VETSCSICVYVHMFVLGLHAWWINNYLHDCSNYTFGKYCSTISTCVHKTVPLSANSTVWDALICSFERLASHALINSPDEKHVIQGDLRIGLLWVAIICDSAGCKLNCLLDMQYIHWRFGIKISIWLIHFSWMRSTIIHTCMLVSSICWKLVPERARYCRS